MITFKQFLTEEETFDINKFKKDCAFVLKMIKGTNVLWHGTETGPKDFEVRTWKRRTKPRNSTDELHNRVNEFMDDKFGDEVRDWMFVTGWKGDAMAYSGMRKPCYMIFPIGKFEWVCSDNHDLRDLTGWHTRMGMEIQDATADELSSEERDKLATNHIIRKLPNVKWYHNTGLAKCIASHNEIMIKCNQFYMISDKSEAAKQIKALL